MLRVDATVKRVIACSAPRHEGRPARDRVRTSADSICAEKNDSPRPLACLPPITPHPKAKVLWADISPPAAFVPFEVKTLSSRKAESVIMAVHKIKRIR
ncbi:hypothetical protein CDAR_496921 [Caerostris darwini]|uniref:Uncharacterized protein n=1 Tax=Caerostris darwini TaxID=1538125 RepID=A0AAV4U5D3_9ARAC|nr:hypothetical protein CDAR_496921 [Caerostris darwini]